MRQLTKHGEVIMIRSHWLTGPDKEGRPASVLLVNDPVPPKTMVESRPPHTQRWDVRMFAGLIAHDMNNMLSPILMAATLLRQSHPDERSAFWIDTIEASARQGTTAVVDQFLPFASAGTGERTRIDVATLVPEVRTTLQEILPASIQLRIEIQNTTAATVGIYTQLYEAFLNVCLNARDAMVHTGTLTIQSYADVLDAYRAGMHPGAVPGPYIVLSCAGTGVGIPPNLIDRIFELFFTTQRSTQRMGLGLSLARQIVESHGGVITVYSNVGEGIEFNLYLPADTHALCK